METPAHPYSLQNVKIWQPDEFDFKSISVNDESTTDQVYMRLKVQKKHRLRLRLEDMRRDALHMEWTQYSDPGIIVFDSRLLESFGTYELMYQMLLVELDVPAILHEQILDKVREDGSDMGISFTNDRGQKVYPLYVDIIVAMEQVRVRSVAQLEISFRHGMVPASESSIKELLQKVRVSGTKDYKENENDEYSCRICLEELEEGSYAMRLPCLHEYHEGCIVKWLNQSRYCPICRFEMPTKKNA